MDFLELRALCHHGIKGQKWGVRRFQNDDGSLTEEGKKRYGITDNDIKIAKKYIGLLDKNCYKTPKSENKEDVVSIIKYDRCRGNNTSRYFNDMSNKTVQLIHHFTKNEKIALSYARVPGFGDIYVKGPGDFNDDDLKKWFKKSPNKNEILHIDFDENYLEHHGIKGQKWGVRRYQNEDGTLTDEGKKLYFQKVNAANNQLKALKAGNKKEADYWKKKQDEIAAIERKNKVVSMNKLKMIGENKVQYTLVYMGKKDYEKSIKESKKSIERGSSFLASLGLKEHSTTLDL